MPLARHSIDAFKQLSPTPAVCIVGYRHQEVTNALGEDNIYVLSDNPTGGTAFAAFEAFSVDRLVEDNPILILTMGDRIVTTTIFRKLLETHQLGSRDADLTLLSAIYEPPKNRGKGRLARDGQRRVVRIVEQRDIDAITDLARRRQLLETTEGNCPLYAIRAETLHRYLGQLKNDNAQNPYYLTDIVNAISRDGGEIRTITTTATDLDYDLLCSDVTKPLDLARLESTLTFVDLATPAPVASLEHAAAAILADRPPGQSAAIAAQLEELYQTAASEQLGFEAAKPLGIGISSGRLRIAFMHPDMGRFFGPAWQMPFGAKDDSGKEQIVILVQSSEDGNIHLFPTNPQFREKLNFVPAGDEAMFPGEEVTDWYSYEGFGTRMAQNLLLSLGYFTDRELAARRQRNEPLPALWISNSMRRPFSLIGNAIASMRTLREGNLGAKVQSLLGWDAFGGLRVTSTGNIPQGGFSSSSAVTVAVKNAINALYELGIGPDMLVHLACQAEYGTGVRAGALDQATEQKGRPSEGTLISSNPRDNYRIIATYPVPADRLCVLFPYSVDRDQAAWRWSGGVYSHAYEPGRLTTAQMRKMTGKAAELAAILTRLPLDTDFFPAVEDDFLRFGRLSAQKQSWVYRLLKQLPLLAKQDELRRRIADHRQWTIEQLMEVHKLAADTASEKADATFESLFSAWRDPALSRTTSSGTVVEETGVPLRAMVAYLFGEVAKNFHLIHHPEQWIECVTRSQLGDRCFDIDPEVLPKANQMMQGLSWEKGFSGHHLMDRWLKRFEATPFDFNCDLDDKTLSAEDPLPLHLLAGTNFFRGLALIDLAEAMLKRAFGADAVAVRINAAGQGDFFQVHIHTDQVGIEQVKQFIEAAFYRRFDLQPDQPFIEPHPGGGAAGVRLNRFDQLPELIVQLRERIALARETDAA